MMRCKSAPGDISILLQPNNKRVNVNNYNMSGQNKWAIEQCST